MSVEDIRELVRLSYESRVADALSYFIYGDDGPIRQIEREILGSIVQMIVSRDDALNLDSIDDCIKILREVLIMKPEETFDEVQQEVIREAYASSFLI